MIQKTVGSVSDFSIIIKVMSAFTRRGRKANLADCMERSISILKFVQFLLNNSNTVCEAKTSGSPLDHGMVSCIFNLFLLQIVIVALLLLVI